MDPYTEYKDSGIEWIGKIPQHWDVAKLKRLCRIINGSTPKSSESEYWDGGIVWITPSDLGKVTESVIHDSSRRITQAGLNSCGTTLCPENSIIVSTRAPIGHIAITKVKTCTNQGCRTLIPEKNVCESKYIYYYLRTSKAILNSLGQGSTFMELSSHYISNFEMPCPPSPEQQTIATFLDRETTRIDTLVEKKQQFIELLEERRSALISHAVTKGLDPDVPMKDSGIEWIRQIPEHWDDVKLKYLISNEPYSFVDGPFGSDLKNEEYTDKGIPLIQLNNIGIGNHITKKLKFISKQKAEDLSKHKIYPNNIVVAKMADPVARAAKVKDDYNEYVIVADCMKLVPDDSIINADFLIYAMNTRYVKEQAENLSNGTTRIRIGLTDTKKLRIVIPPLQEQQAIANYLDRETSQIDTLIEKTEQSIEYLKEYRTALISSAVTGKIDVRGTVSD
jgi:type I restriction enzyme S subunit